MAHERQSAWLLGLEGTFRHFGGVTHEVLVDNAKALVDEHNRQDCLFVPPRSPVQVRPRNRGTFTPSLMQHICNTLAT